MELKDYLVIVGRQKVISTVVAIVLIAAWVYAIYLPEREQFTAVSKILSSSFSAEQRIFTKFTGNNLAPYITQATRMRLATSEGVINLAYGLIKDWDKVGKFTFPNEKVDIRQLDDITIEEIKGSYDIVPFEDSQIFVIRAHSYMPERAVTIANGVGYALCLHVKNIYKGSPEKGIELMKKSLSSSLKLLQEEEATLKAVGFDPTNTSVLADQTRMKDELSAMKLRLETIEGMLKGLQARKGEHEARGKVMQSEEIEVPAPYTQLYIDLASKISRLKQEIHEKSLYYKETHPTIVDAENKIKFYDAQLKEEEGRIAGELKQKAVDEKRKRLLEENRAKIAEIEEQLAAKNEETKNSQAHIVELLAKIDELDKKIVVYWKMKAEYDEQNKKVDKARAEFQRNQTVLNDFTLELELFPDVLRVEEAAKQGQPEEKRSTKQVPIVILISLIIGISCGYLRDYLDDRIRSPHDLKRYMNMNTLGIIPKTAEGNEMLLGAALRSPLAETYSHLATVLNTSIQKEGAKVFLITSTTAKEGKTTISANTAIALARMGKNTCLIDCDLRRPNVHKIFHADNSVGVSTFLSGKASAKVLLNGIADHPIVIPDGGAQLLEESHEDEEAQEDRSPLDEVLQQTEVENLSIVTCGPSPVNPVSLLESHAMKELIRILKNRFDAIVVDSPPIDSTADPLILSAVADKTILVVACWATRKQQLSWCKRLLSNADVNVLGAVLNRSAEQSRGYYYYYYDPKAAKQRS